MTCKTPDSSIIVITGVDGSGKTTLTDWLKKELVARRHNPGFVWSRFNNYLSLPFLAGTRLTGHNYYTEHENIRMGFHDFEKLPKLLRFIFVCMQIIDVNIATFLKLFIPSKKNKLTICERGPWDTLVDVVSDIKDWRFIRPPYPKLFFGQIENKVKIILIDRNADLIEASRPELKFDKKLRDRQKLYRELAIQHDWKVLQNDGDIEEAKTDFLSWLDLNGY